MKNETLLKLLKVDRQKAVSDLQRTQEQLIGVRYVIAYLDSKIKELEGGK